MKYCAFLRGVNVKGTAMKMSDVCRVFEKAGMMEVSSVLATGNIIFSSEQKSEELKKILEKAMSEHFQYEAYMFIKNADEIRMMYSACPFKKQPELHIYIFVTDFENQDILFKEFQKSNVSEEELASISENTFFWQVSKGNTLNSEFGKIIGNKAFKNHITTRNLNTFEKIITKL